MEQVVTEEMKGYFKVKEFAKETGVAVKNIHSVKLEVLI